MTTIADIKDQVVALNDRMTEVAALLGDASGKVMAIAQQAAEENIELRRALGEALDIADQNLFVPDGNAPVSWSGTVTVDSGYPHRTKARIEELRKLIGAGS